MPFNYFTCKGNPVKRLFLFIVIIALSFTFFYNQNLLSIAAGVAIFLFGMKSLEEGFRFFVGGLLDKFLKKITDNLYKSILFGTVITTLMQSSGLAAVIAISFISAGLISVAQGVGIILGGNIGTTTGAWLIAGLGLKISIATYALPMLVFGMLFIFQESKRLKGIGYALAGLGFSFLGIAYMKEGFDAFKATIDLTQYSADGFTGIILFAIIGAVMTIVMQSSHASLVLILTALSASQITYENAIALTIGANIGTTITAVLGALGAGMEGKKLAAAHFLINTLTGLLLIGFVPQFIHFIDHTAPFFGIAEQDYTLKLALYHTYFNLFCVLLFAPLVHHLVRLLNYFFQPKITAENAIDDVLFINDAALDFPDTAQATLLKETKHLYNNVYDIIAQGLSVTKEDISSGMEIEDILKRRDQALHVNMDDYYERRIKEIYGKIITFAIVAQGKFSDVTTQQFIPIKNATIDIVEAFKAAKHMQKNMLRYLESDNEYIKNEYNHIRKTLIKHLRTMQMIFNTSEEDVAVLLLSKLQLDAQNYDIAANKSLDNLIRTNKITYTMATSLMNDTSYAYTIASELSKVAHTLFVHATSESTEGREALILNEAEISDLTHASSPRSTS
ncbi:putative sodium-dependent phosphate transporter [Sulfurospirillum multivorans DSM 12446]|uniref:Sodium-dependent phosphate transporter n=1 Tax=Sulfurospirillum multivorans (strain DM 12446 / JCM 15788 / NBRC 109480) TaxID=1150621 RepID=A0AA86AQD4_SULMK|nr:putative sodium-dependent phosphate transporter [Sulfurospirillum multivorans DSM 12446]